MTERSPEREDEFYVGYLAMPAGHARLLRVAVPLVLLLIGAAAVLIAMGQREVGTGAWSSGAAQTWRGVMHAAPYPWLQVVDGPDGVVVGVGVGGVPIVELGKIGAQERAARFDGKLVEVDGWRVDRDGRMLLELEGGESVREVSGRMPGGPEMRGLGNVELVGEIVDYKCFLGVMRPGDGRGHQACARLCIGGGIPPVLISYAGGSVTHAIVVGDGGEAVNERVLEWVGMPVRVTGRLERRGGLLYVRVGDGGVVGVGE